MTVRKNAGPGAASRRAFLGVSASALATGSVLAGRQSGMAQGAQSTPQPPLDTTTADDNVRMISVMDFGALGDAVSDDTTAIQAAIDSLGDTGGAVFFPGGDYVTSRALTVRSSIDLVGESLQARILAATPDAAIKVADPGIFNDDIHIRRLHIRNEGTTPVGIDARNMSGCVIEDCAVANFSQYGIYYGGNTDADTASWSNSLIGSVVRNSPTCIYLNGSHSEGGSPANWITIERCLIIPTDTPESIGIDLANGDTVRIVNNDIGYAVNATAIVIRQHLYGQLEYNRFEDIGEVEPSHQIEKEYGHSNFHITGIHANIYYQRAEYLQFSGDPSDGTFSLRRDDEATGDIAFSTDGETLASNIRSALEELQGVGTGNVEVTPVTRSLVRIAWLNGRGRSTRASLAADAIDLNGENDIGLSVAQGSYADAIRHSGDIALTGAVNDTESPIIADLGPHLDVGIPLIMRRPMLSVNPFGTMALQFQQLDGQYPTLGLSVDGRIQWSNAETGQHLGGLRLHSSNPESPKLGWDDNLHVALPRHAGPAGDSSVDDVLAGSLFREEGGSGERDQLRFGMKDKDDATYARHLFPGFAAAGTLQFPSVDAGGVATQTLTAAGAHVGDAVVVTPPAELEEGLMATGFVSSADTVSIRLYNGSADEVSPAEATWSVVILQP